LRRTTTLGGCDVGDVRFDGRAATVHSRLFHASTDLYNSLIDIWQNGVPTCAAIYPWRRATAKGWAGRCDTPLATHCPTSLIKHYHVSGRLLHLLQRPSTTQKQRRVPPRCSTRTYKQLAPPLLRAAGGCALAYKRQNAARRGIRTGGPSTGAHRRHASLLASPSSLMPCTFCARFPLCQRL